ncbi:hypothetical protein [Desulfosporosinus nitroreducens]|uniref:hypothetical protein n=1 Tax=Desulfosporosinus nitroreducens TaxID=2018668 RepID=UPI00207C8C9B|nr:hypothetical protein [Desulfosporosinus nitroreducens]MCO1603139.1 hypothetical protein [Desulfosporosinus nitroreducens]
MSRFTFIASDYELREIDLSGIIKGTVKELREMNLNPRPELSFNLDKLRDDVKANWELHCSHARNMTAMC